MRNPNGPSIEEKEAMQDQLDDLNEAYLRGKASIQRPLAGLIRKWEDALTAFTSPYYTVERPMDATKVLEQCIAEFKALR